MEHLYALHLMRLYNLKGGYYCIDDSVGLSTYKVIKSVAEYLISWLNGFSY
jgi:hypothetical protein